MPNEPNEPVKEMTVRRLIELLQTMPQDRVVIARDLHGYDEDIESVKAAMSVFDGSPIVAICYRSS